MPICQVSAFKYPFIQYAIHIGVVVVTISIFHQRLIVKRSHVTDTLVSVEILPSSMQPLHRHREERSLSSLVTKSMTLLSTLPFKSPKNSEEQIIIVY